MHPEELAIALEAHEDYRILRRFKPRARYAAEPWGLGDVPPALLGAFVDCETTGLDRETDEIIELGIVPFTFDPKAGVIFDVRMSDAVWGFEEPKGEITDDVQEVHGITLDMVRGHRLDEAKINAVVGACALIIAHNAEYDRPIFERRLPVFTSKHWACSQRDVGWERYGFRWAKLEHLLMTVCGEFYDAHRAVDDCLVGLHVLAASSLDNRPAFAHLLESARQPSVRIWAIDSPFPKKEKLKARRPRGNRYHWSDGKGALRKGWYIDVKPDDVDAEKEWLLANIYGARVEERHALVLEKYGSKVRYSNRVGL